MAPHRFADIVEFFEKYDLQNEIRVDNLQKCVLMKLIKKIQSFQNKSNPFLIRNNFFTFYAD